MRDLPKGTISFCWRVPNCLFRLGSLKAYSTGLIFAALACSMVSYELNAPFFVQISSLLNCTICLREIIATTKKFIDARSELSSFIFQIAELNLFISRVLSACIILNEFRSIMFIPEFSSLFKSWNKFRFSTKERCGDFLFLCLGRSCKACWVGILLLVWFPASVSLHQTI